MVKDCYNDFNAEVKVVSFKRRCRYHKHKGEKFSIEELTPKNLCIHAFHTAYPSCLGLLYDMKNDNKDYVILKCPNSKNFIKLRVYRVPNRNILNLLFNKSKVLVSKITGLSFDMIDKDIYIEIIENNNCPKNYYIGETFKFNTIGGFCPASFDAVYASILSSNKNPAKVTCPSHKVSVVYDIRKLNYGK